MPSTYSSDQVINKAAGDLGKWVPGETLGEVEESVLNDALDAVIAEISKIMVISDRESIPDFAFEVIGTMVAAFASSQFSGVPLDYTQVMEPLEKRLRYLVSQQPTYEPLAAYYF